MFGEEALLGKFDLTIDTKNRLTIPTLTKREVGENLVIVKDPDLNVYRIYSESKITEIYDELNQKILKSITKEEEINYKKKILELSKTIVKMAKINTSGKINLGTNFTNISNAILIGANDHLILELKK